MMRIAVPAVTTLIVVVSFVALAGWNRSGPPRSVITVTERELPVVWASSAEDDPGLHLRIAYESRSDPLDALNWLTEDRLRALGFPLEWPIGSPEAAERYTRMLPRLAWVAFEYEGEAWREIERRRLLREPSPRPLGGLEPSRLVPVDAAPDWEPLATRYPSGHLITRATIQVSYIGSDVPESSGLRGPLVYGWIRRLHPADVTVPPAIRERMASFARRPTGAGMEAAVRPPRYQVELAVGRLGIPYVRDVRPLQ